MEELVRGALELEVRVEGASPQVLAEIDRTWPRANAEAAHVTDTAPSALDSNGTRTYRFALGDESDVPKIADLLIRDGARLHALVPHQTTLEDLFIESVETREV